MADEPDTNPEPPKPDAARLSTGRVARSAQVGGLVGGQSLRWAAMRTANRARSPERAAAAQRDRTAALVTQLVEQLAQMRGAAMKLGQMISMVDLDGLEPDQADELRKRLATLRDDIPPMRFAKVEKLMRSELGGPVSQVFAEFDHEAFAAASIGQVHRARTVDGQDVAVKVQYPGIAEAVETDLRNAGLLLPLLRRIAPALDSPGLLQETRDRVGAELDYELEAANHRRIARLMRGHPFITVPAVRTDLSTRRVLVTEYVEGQRFDEVRVAEESVRDRYGEIVFRFFFGLLYRDRIALGDPHPGNYLLTADGRIAFLDFGLISDVAADHLDAERALARAVRDGDGDAVKAALVAAGYLPAARADEVDPAWALRLMEVGLRWYAVPGYHRMRSADQRRARRDQRDAAGERDDDERAAGRAQAGQLTLPPAALLIRRMHALVAITLTQLRAGADWGAIAAEYLYGEPPATELGRAEAELRTRTVGG